MKKEALMTVMMMMEMVFDAIVGFVFVSFDIREIGCTCHTHTLFCCCRRRRCHHRCYRSFIVDIVYFICFIRCHTHTHAYAQHSTVQNRATKNQKN